MKKLILLLSVICFWVACKKDNPERVANNQTPTTPNTTSLMIDVGGGMNGAVYCLQVYNGELYAGGEFTTAGSVFAEGIAKWNGTSWSALPNGPSAAGIGTVIVGTMAVFNNELYVGGGFDSIGNQLANGFAKWNGSSWSAPDNGNSLNSRYGWIRKLAVSNNTLYAVADSIYKFNGSSWTNTNFGKVDGGSHYVNSVCDFNGNLYVAGSFSTAGGNTVGNIAYYDGLNWLSPGIGVQLGVAVPQISDMIVFNGELYVTGSFQSAGGIAAPNVAKWNGSSWYAVGVNGLVSGPIFSNPSLLVNYNSTLYAFGGDSTSLVTNTPADIIFWDGSIWQRASFGLYQSSLIRCMAVYNNSLYVGGVLYYDSSGLERGAIAKSP